MTPFLETALDAAHQAGEFLRTNFGSILQVNDATLHDIKLQLDIESQTLITSLILAKFPEHAIYGEEGIEGNQEGEFQWIIDPIDGTVNFFYGIPHFCISIALRRAGEIVLGVIHDPMRRETWSVEKGEKPLLNGKPIVVSDRTQLSDAILSVGFAKTKKTIDIGMPLLEKMVYRARKCRMMGSAALDMAYVACGRLDAYIEQGISLWDVAAGLILVESAGGKIEMKPREDAKDKYAIVASSGRIDLNV